MALQILDITDGDNVRIKQGSVASANNGAVLAAAGGVHTAGIIPSSDDLTGIELRIKSIFINDNRTPAFTPLFPGYANLYLVTIVASDVPNQMAGPVNVEGFERIGDHEALRYRDSTLYYFQQDTETMPTPTQLHVVATVVKSKKGLRNAGKIMESLGNDSKYNELVGQISNLAANATPAGAIIGIVRELGGIIGGYLGEVEDRPLASVMRSFTGIGGDWDKLGVSPVSLSTKCVNFNFDLFVRNAGKEAALTASLGKQQPG